MNEWATDTLLELLPNCENEGYGNSHTGQSFLLFFFFPLARSMSELAACLRTLLSVTVYK
jgi:hypothetical protein